MNLAVQADDACTPGTEALQKKNSIPLELSSCHLRLEAPHSWEWQKHRWVEATSVRDSSLQILEADKFCALVRVGMKTGLLLRAQQRAADNSKQALLGEFVC